MSFLDLSSYSDTQQWYRETSIDVEYLYHCLLQLKFFLRHVSYWIWKALWEVTNWKWAQQKAQLHHFHLPSCLVWWQRPAEVYWTQFTNMDCLPFIVALILQRNPDTYWNSLYPKWLMTSAINSFTVTELNPWNVVWKRSGNARL